MFTHWLLDVHFEEDSCRLQDDFGQKNLYIMRKMALNMVERFKQSTGSKKAVSNIMLDCLVNSKNIMNLLSTVHGA